MAKKTRSRKTKYKKRNPVAALLDGLLTLLDTLLEGVAAAAVAILRGIGKLLLLALRGLLWLAKHALLLLAGLGVLAFWPGVWGIVLYLIYAIFGNLVFIIIQRYNRPRLVRLYERKRAKRSKEA